MILTKLSLGQNCRLIRRINVKEKIELGQIFCGEYSENCEVDRISCPFSDCMAEVWAEKVLSLGYHKTVWHKVADGDLPTKTGRYLTRYDTGYNRVLLYCVEDNLGPYDEDYDFEKDDNMMNIKKGFNDFDDESCEYFTTNSVVAWMEIPEYE